MERRHPEDTTPRVSDLFASGIATMTEEAPEQELEVVPTPTAPDEAPQAPEDVKYDGPVQAEVVGEIHMSGKEAASPPPEVALTARPTVDLADDEDIEW